MTQSGHAPGPAAPAVAAVTKAVIPLAGLGTRLLPATKTIPKGMLPIIDKPVVQYIVEEAVAAGLSDVLMITSSGQQSITDHFDPTPDLRTRLATAGEHQALADIRALTERATVSFVQQDAPRGLGDAILRAADHVGDEPFAVLFGDNLLRCDDNLLTALIAARHRLGGSIIALMAIPPDQVPSFGVVAFSPTDDPDIVAITDLVEKPTPNEAPPVTRRRTMAGGPPSGHGAPSSWIVIGRCVCDPAIFGALQDAQPGRGGEIQLTDALRTLAVADRSAGGGVHGVLFRGRRFDTGDKQDYLRTLIEFACSRPDIAQDFVPWLRNMARFGGIRP